MPGGGGFLRLVEAAKLLMIALMAIHQDGVGSKWFATQMSLIDCNEFRVWIIDKEGQSRIINIKELYKNAINIVDITTTYQVINRQYFNAF